jgi:hypothetical protein
MTRFGIALPLVLGLSLFGCGGDDGMDGMDMTGGANTALAAPVLKTVEPMAGVLHIAWETTSSCEQIHAQRKTSTTDFTTAFAVPGTEKNKMDAAANQNETYTYRLMCAKGDQMSGYSNEMSANPTQE